MLRTVSDWMTPHPPTIRRDTSIGTCARSLREHGAQYLVVVDESGALRGVLGDSEVWRRGELTSDGFVPHDADELELIAQQITRLVEIEVGPQAALALALEALVDSIHDVLVVVDDERRPLGLLTEADAVARCLADLPEVSPPVVEPKVIVDKESPADEARSRMARKRARHALVLDGDRLYGVLSFRDVAVEHRLSDGTTAGAVASTPAHSAPEGVSFRDAATALLTHSIGCLPIVDAGQRPTGWITRTHVVSAWLQSRPQA